MADFQRVVEFLRDLRQGPLQSVTEEITQSATEYASLCVHANERLRKCSSLLQQGLRTEALHLADESPNLLDLVAALDLPDPQAWADFCQNNGLPVPPPLALDRAAQLNDAYAQDQPLEHLLGQHRLLALSRGPIAERLSTLRKIAAIDAGSATWEKDIRVFEKARLKELPTTFYNAVKHRDDAAITHLMVEVTQQPWYEPVPADLLAAVSDAYARMKRAAVEVELRKMVEPLREAFAARSFHECQAMTLRWKKVMEDAGVAMIAPELTDEIRPVVAYVAEQEKRVEYLRKFRDSCKAFGKLLDIDASEAQLEMGYSRLKEFNEPIPPEITARYEAKGTSRQRVIDRKHRMRMIGIGASAAGVALVSIVVFVLVSRSADAKKWADKINALVTPAHPTFDQLQLAQQTINDLRKTHPSLLDESAMASALRNTQAKQAEYDRDASTIRGLMEKFDGAAKEANAVAGNKHASLDQLLAAAANVQDVLNQSRAAGDLGWADSPDKKFASAESQLDEVLANMRSRASTMVLAEVDADVARLDAIGPSPANMTDAGEQLSTMSSRLQTLKGMIGLDDPVKARVAALEQRVNQQRDSIGAASTIAGELGNIRQNAGSAESLKRALTGYVQRFPMDSRVPDFTSAIERLDLAKDADAWREMTSPWAGQFAPPNAPAAQKRIDAITAYLAAHPNSPMTATAAAYTDYLRRAADALAEKGTWQQGFNDLFGNPLLTDLAYMETSDGQRFYVLGDIKLTTHSINDRVSQSFEAINPTDVLKKMQVTVDAPTTLTTKAPVPAPHAKVVADLDNELKTIDAANWDTWGMDAVDKLVKNKQISVVIKAMIVEQALKTENIVADWALGDSYTVAITELARQKPENLPLLDTSRISAGTIKSLQGTMDAIPPAAAMKEKLASAKNALFKMVSFDVIGTAVLLKDEDGNWSIGGKTLAMDGNLWTVVPGSGAAAAAPAVADATPPSTSTAPASAPAVAAPAPANPGALVQIGTVTGGKYALYDNAVRDLPQGTIVYITQP